MTPVLRRNFWKFALPSMLSQLLNSLFIIVDGFFIGQNLGDAGLAAINVAWPMVSLLQAVSMAIGTGGSVRLAIAIGRGDHVSALQERRHAVWMLVGAAAVLGVGFFFTYPAILPLLGANAELYPLAADYIRVVCIFAACQVFTTGVMPLLRGTGRALIAMALTVLGLLGNITLDWMFIQHFHWGMRGVAFATAMSQGVCGFLGLGLLLAQRGWPKVPFRLEPKRMLRIMQYGFSAFGLTMSISVLLVMNNLQALRWGGTQGVAVYAMLSYILGSVMPLVTGVGDGIQPLLGNARGADDRAAIAGLRRMGFSLAVGAALVCSAGCWLLRDRLPLVFGASPAAAAETAGAMWTLVLAFPFMAVVRFRCSYFCALGMPGESSALAYGEPLLAQPLFLFLLPLHWQLTGVWLSYPAAVMTMSALSSLLLHRHRRAMQAVPRQRRRRRG